MEITNHGKQLNVPRPHFLSTAGAANATDGSKAGEGVKRADEASPQRLLERLQGNVEARQQLLSEVRARVQEGEYLTRAAAEHAADQLLGL